MWILSFGTWGDALAELGFLKYQARLAMQKVNFVYYCFDKNENILKLMKCQSEIGEAVHIEPPNLITYQGLHRRWCGGRQHLAPEQAWLPHLLEGSNIDWHDVKYAKLLTTDSWGTPVYHYNELVLPEDSVQYATEIMKEARQGDRKVILLHPYSFNSTTKKNHWSGWEAAIDWLSKQDCTVLLTGSGWKSSHEGMTNLIGKTPSMNEVFALASQCDYIVTTSNSLSMYSTIIRKPTVVCCNTECSRRNNYFGRWINQRQNRLVRYGDRFRRFQEQFHALGG